MCDLREFCATLSSIQGQNSPDNEERINRFYLFLDFYLKSLFEMVTVVIEFLNGKPITRKKEITSKLFFNSGGDGALLVLGGQSPENVVSSYIYSFYLSCLLKKFVRKLEDTFNLSRLKRRMGIALAFGEVTAVEYSYKISKPGETGAGEFYNISSLISQGINIASRVEGSNKDHINADISLDSSFTDELYRFMFPALKVPGEYMKEFKTLKTKKERLDVLNMLDTCDIRLLLSYMGHHDMKGSDTVVHIVSPVLVNIDPDLEKNKVEESEELIDFYSAVKKKLGKDIYKDLVTPLQAKLLTLMGELEEL